MKIKLNKKNIILGFFLFIILGITLVGKVTHAEFRSSLSVPLATGKISYKHPDFKVISMYMQENIGNSVYNEIQNMPSSSDYQINEKKSYCYLVNSNEHDEKVVLKTIDNKHTFENLSKNEKCYLYFDLKETNNPKINSVDFNITSNSISLTVDAIDDVGVTEYYYSIDDDVLAKGTDNTKIFNNLSSNTNYTIRVYVKDAAGNKSNEYKQVLSTKSEQVTISYYDSSSTRTYYSPSYSVDNATNWLELSTKNENLVFKIGTIIKAGRVPGCGCSGYTAYYFCSTPTCGASTSDSSYNLLGKARETNYIITGKEKSYYYITEWCSCS